MTKLFENVGSKLQSYAKIIAIIEMVIIFISGLVVMINDSFLIGLLIWIVGALASIVTAWFLIGFGVIVEASEKQLGKSNVGSSTSSEKPVKVKPTKIKPMRDLCQM